MVIPPLQAQPTQLNCRACHTEEGARGKGDTLVQATREGCTACHSADYGVLFDQWRHELQVQEEEAGQLLEQVRKQLAGAIIEPGAKERLTRKFAEAELNINLVRNGGGLHNRAYSLQLLDVARLTGHSIADHPVRQVPAVWNRPLHDSRAASRCRGGPPIA